MLDFLTDLPFFNILKVTIYFLGAISILVTVHEWGHFWVARRCGVKVLRFSLGFGKILYKWKDKTGTEFTISLIPLGGYVKMLENEGTPLTPIEQTQTFSSKSIAQRAAIISAGPIANIILAILLYWIVNLTTQVVLRPVVSSVVPNSIAEQAGFKAQDTLLSIAGAKTRNWRDVIIRLIDQDKMDIIPFEVINVQERGDVNQRRRLEVTKWLLPEGEKDILEVLGVIPFVGKLAAALTEIVPGSSADRSGLKVGDSIISMNDIEIGNPKSFVNLIQANPEKQLRLEVKRSDTIVEIVLIPERKIVETGVAQGIAGFSFEFTKLDLPNIYQVEMRYSVIEALSLSVQQSYRMIVLIVKEIGRLISGQRELASIGGPITLASGIGQSAQYGIISFLDFLALISLNLGLVNLLPLPILDGGHLLFLLIEKVTNRPVSDNIKSFCYLIGMALLAWIMGLAFFNDFSRLMG